MFDQLLQAYQSRAEREQRMLLIGGIVAVLVLVLAIVLPLQRSVGAGAQRIERKRNDLAWLRAVAPQLGAGAANATEPLHDSLVVLIDRSARQSGLEKSLVGSHPNGDGTLDVSLEQVPFDSLIAWLSQLRARYGVQAQTANVDVGSTPGVVNATLVLHGP